MSNANGRSSVFGSGEPRFGTSGFWTFISRGIIVAAIIAGAGMLLRHETAIAVNTETVANLKNQIADVKNDTSLIRSDIKELGRSVRRN